MKKTTKKRKPSKGHRVSRRTKSTAKARGSLVSRLQLRMVRLLRLESSLSLEDGRFPKKTSLNIKCDVGRTPVDDAVIVTLYIASLTTHPETKGSRAEVNLTEQLVFQGEFFDDESPQDIQQLIATSLLAAWPYVREVVHTVSSKMHIPPIVIPLLSIDQQSKSIRIGDQLVDALPLEFGSKK